MPINKTSNKSGPVLPAIAPVEALLGAAQPPVYAIDPSGVIVYANAALCDWLVAPLDQVVGSRVEYHSEAPPGAGAVSADLCPPPQALAGQPLVAALAITLHDGKLRQREFRFCPLPAKPHDGQSATAAVLAIGDTKDLPPDSAEADAADNPLHLAIRRFRAEQAAGHAIDPLLGVSAATSRARRQATAAIRSQANCLITGPGGAGQTRVARAIHYAVSDAAAGLWQFSCRGMRAQELERLVSKSEPSATLLAVRLDELSPEAQHALVRLLGAQREQPRLLATIEAPDDGPTTELDPNLAAMFGIEVQLPQLADRLADLPWLAQLFIEQCNAGATHQVGSIEPAALDQLALYAWPRNVDQLAGVIAEAHANAKQPEIRVTDLPPLIRHAAVAAATIGDKGEPLDLAALTARVEREVIERAILRAGGNRSKAARLVGMTRPKFYRRLKELGIDPPTGGTAP
ncbi:helix-turn-helix domain-containing protein [Pirellulimonas nuda]|nr:helix-turn-helix domain-containing protein [Pirellulimonas nuda]